MKLRVVHSSPTCPGKSIRKGPQRMTAPHEQRFSRRLSRRWYLHNKGIEKYRQLPDKEKGDISKNGPPESPNRQSPRMRISREPITRKSSVRVAVRASAWVHPSGLWAVCNHWANACRRHVCL